MSLIGPLRHRPLLLAGMAMGMVAGGVASALGAVLPVALLLGWCIGAAFWMALVTLRLLRCAPTALRRRTEDLDEGRWAMLGATATAALASLGAVVWALADAPTPAPVGTVVLGLGAIVVSWFFVHVLFALHYAHEHWRVGEGVDFPGETEPGFDAFLYFGFTIGMTFQVSDATTRTARMRRLVLVHGLLSFLFNAVILGAAVNLAAALAR